MHFPLLEKKDDIIFGSSATLLHLLWLLYNHQVVLSPMMNGVT